MLARYLRTNTRPVRYALSPEQTRAVQNYLMMSTRAYDVPRAHTAHAPALLPMYRQFPRATGALGGLLQTGDPGSLMAYLGMAEDSGVSHPLLDLLAQLHGHIQPGSPQFDAIQLLSQAHDPRSRVPGGNRAMRGTMLNRLEETLGDALVHHQEGMGQYANTQLPPGVLRSALPRLREHGDMAMGGHPLAPVQLHDLAHILRIHPQIGHYAGRQAEMVQDDAQGALRTHLASLIPQ